MRIDANSTLRRVVLRAAIEQYAEAQLKLRKRVIEETGNPTSSLVLALDDQHREALDVLEEIDYHERRIAHPAASLRNDVA